MGLYEQLVAAGYPPEQARQMVMSIIQSSMPRERTKDGMDVFRDNMYATNSFNGLAGDYSTILQTGQFDPMSFVPKRPMFDAAAQSSDPKIRGIYDAFANNQSLPMIIKRILDPNQDGTADYEADDPETQAYINYAEKMFDEQLNPQLSGLAEYAQERGIPNPLEEYSFETLPTPWAGNLAPADATLSKVQGEAARYKGQQLAKPDQNAKPLYNPMGGKGGQDSTEALKAKLAGITAKKRYDSPYGNRPAFDNSFGGRNWLQDETYQKQVAPKLQAAMDDFGQNYFLQQYAMMRAQREGRTPFNDYMANQQQMMLMGLLPQR